MIIIVLAVLLVASLVGLVMATDLRDTPKPAASLEFTKPAADTILAEEVITVTRRRTIKATRA